MAIMSPAVLLFLKRVLFSLFILYFSLDYSLFNDMILCYYFGQNLTLKHCSLFFPKKFVLIAEKMQNLQKKKTFLYWPLFICVRGRVRVVVSVREWEWKMSESIFLQGILMKVSSHNWNFSVYLFYVIKCWFMYLNNWG